MKTLLGLLTALAVVLGAGVASAAVCSSYPFTLTNGQTADANQVMANFNSILSCVNTQISGPPASPSGSFQFNNGGNLGAAPVTDISSSVVQLGPADSASPAGMLFQAPSVAAGNSNTAGAAFTLQASRGTGSGAGGSFIFTVCPAGSSGTGQNNCSNALTLDQAAHTISGGSSPSCGSGCSAIAGTDTHFSFTMSSNLSATINFAQTWAAAPICTWAPVNAAGSGLFPNSYLTMSTTQLVVTGNGAGVQPFKFVVSCSQ